jgi:hypothetical protein
MQFGILALHYSDFSLRTCCCSRAAACAYMQFDNLPLQPGSSHVAARWTHGHILKLMIAYQVIAYRFIVYRVIAASGFCSIGLLQHQVFAASGFCSIGFLQHRVYGISGFCISGYCLRGKISGFCHIGFLFKITRVLSYRVIACRVIDIGFLTVGFLISGFDLEPSR